MNSVIALLVAIAVGSTFIAAHHLIRVASARLRVRAADGPAEAFRDMFIFVDSETLLAASAGGAALFAVLSLLATNEPLIAMCCASLAFATPRVAQAVTRARRVRRLSRQLPDMLMTLASGLRAGASLGQALSDTISRTPKPLSAELALVARKRRLGVSFESGLREMESRIDLPDYRLFVTTLVLSMSVGGSIAESLERLAATVLRRHVIEDKILALTAQARLQAMVVTALPLVLLAALTAIDPAAMRPLFTTPQGWWVLGVVLVLELSGWLLMRRIARIEV